MSLAAWERALDAFAARLADQRAALHAGQPDAVGPFAPPPSMGPLPAELRARAEDLLQEAAEVQAHLEASLAGPEVQVVRRLVSATTAPTVARYVDRPL
ncbi:MAG: hypothetical protein WD232_00290 [Acidimicrobiales bacterium]